MPLLCTNYHESNSLLQCLYIHPSPLLPTLLGQFGQLNSFRSFKQRPGKRFVIDHMLQEQFPLDFEGIVE